MSEHELPPVNFTRDELTYLQDMLSRERASWFNYYEALIEDDQDLKAARAHKHYEMIRVLRDKVYRMNGRDTLAPGNHEQRWWDQRHGYD